MFDITLLSSSHSIHGKCNPEELYLIIEQLQPEVIFEELSYDGFEMIYSAGYQPQTVEAITIKKYLQKYPIKHLPVDNYPINEADLLSDAQLIWNYSSEYRDLWEQKLLRLSQNGYYFLNSDECTEIMNQLERIEEDVLKETNNVVLLNEHKKEKALHDKRENEMLRAIYNYVQQYTLDNAIFICGAQHRKAIKHKIKDYKIKDNFKLNWKFFNEI
jgi:hypothetical protein